MNKSQLVRDLKHRLSSLLEDSMFTKAWQDRAAQRVGSLGDAIIAHNIAVSEEILQLDASSVNGVVTDRKLNGILRFIWFRCFLNLSFSGSQMHMIFFFAAHPRCFYHYGLFETVSNYP